MEYKDYLKKAEAEIKEPPGLRRDALVSLSATADQISDTYERLLKDTETCAECRVLGFYCEPCSVRLSRAKYKMHEALWEFQIMESPPPTDETEYREWLHSERNAWILIGNRIGNPHSTPRDLLNSYPVQWIDSELMTLGASAESIALNLERIKWNDTAALLGYLVRELVEGGYITAPQRAGKPNWAAVARTLHAAFEIKKENGDSVTSDTIYMAVKPEGDADYKTGKGKFKIYPHG